MFDALFLAAIVAFFAACALSVRAQLGGETATLQGDDVVGAVLAYARERNATQIVVGRTRRGRWRLGQP